MLALDVALERGVRGSDLERSTIGSQPVFAALFNFAWGNRGPEHSQWGFCGTVSLELHRVKGFKARLLFA